MAAQRIYRWDYIAPNEGTNLFYHGYDDNTAVSYSIVVYAGFGDGVPFPAAHATLTQGETFRHVDGTTARKVYVQNNAPFNSCTVDLLELSESF